MLNRKIEIVAQESHSCTISVDGNSIQIKHYKNHINLEHIEEIERVFKNIDDVFTGKKTFSDVCKLISGKNLLTILDVMYAENTITLFEEKYNEAIAASYVSFEDFFNSFFDFNFVCA